MLVLKHLRIDWKIPLAIVGVIVLATAVTGGISYYTAATELERQAMRNFWAIGASRKEAIQNYLTSIRQDLRVQANNPSVARMLGAFQDAWRELDGDPKRRLSR